MDVTFLPTLTMQAELSFSGMVLLEVSDVLTVNKDVWLVPNPQVCRGDKNLARAIF
jgi:hypothetical protein